MAGRNERPKWFRRNPSTRAFPWGPQLREASGGSVGLAKGLPEIVTRCTVPAGLPPLGAGGFPCAPNIVCQGREVALGHERISGEPASGVVTSETPVIHLEVGADLQRFEADFTRVVVTKQSDAKTSLNKRFSRGEAAGATP